MHPSTTIAVSEDVAFRQIDEEGVVLDLETGTYFGLNVVATRAWSLLSAGHTLGDVRAALEREFDVAPDVLERDLTAWLKELLDKRLVRPA